MEKLLGKIKPISLFQQSNIEGRALFWSQTNYKMIEYVFSKNFYEKYSTSKVVCLTAKCLNTVFMMGNFQLSSENIRLQRVFNNCMNVMIFYP